MHRFEERDFKDLPSVDRIDVAEQVPVGQGCLWCSAEKWLGAPADAAPSQHLREESCAVVSLQTERCASR